MVRGEACKKRVTKQQEEIFERKREREGGRRQERDYMIVCRTIRFINTVFAVAVLLLLR